MKDIKKQLIEKVGKPCKDYSPFCFTCIAWHSYNVLEEVFEIVPKDEIKRKK